MLKDMKMSAFICYDLRFPEVFQAVSGDASVILVPANWPASRKDAWRCLLKARAIENQCYVVGINCVGRQQEIDYSGYSGVIDPTGACIHEMPEEEGMYLCDIENDVKEYREKFPLKADRRPELYRWLKLNS
jgi:predicted amidohydrolase